jgi:precorrin-6B methylase 2
VRCSENFGENLALEGAFVSPTTRRPLTWDAERAVFVAAGDAERFGCIADEVPDFRPDGCGLPADEIAGFRARLAELWKRSEAEPLPPQALVPASSADTRRYWRFVARSELTGFLRWVAAGRPPYTQDQSMRRYAAVTDVYPRARRHLVTVFTSGGLATAPLALFKELSLGSALDLIRREGIRSVLDFGCGWGANTIVLRRAFPDLHIWSFDYSPFRVLATQFNLRTLGLTPYRLFIADGSRLPLPDRSIDLVLTTHVLEQMQEVLSPALTEIQRVARRFAWHVEPTYRYARWLHRLRVRRLGYPRDIAERAVANGWRLLEQRPASPAWGRTPGELIVLARP